MCKKLFTFLTGLVFFYPALADNFVVTSNADNGAGTLREAITLAAANGTAVQDIISFNLPADVLSRTFSVLSVLPALSSHLIIDATTQPGAAFGISNTKIILSYTLPAAPPGTVTFNAFNAENAQDIEIYGIYFRSYSGSNDYSGVAIYCNNSKNIRIGAPGKGNLFAGWLTAIGHPEGFGQLYAASDNILVQSNIFGLLEDGNTTTYGVDALHLFDVCCKFAISFIASTNITIGGTTPGEGNLINFSVCAISLINPSGNPAGSSFIIQNNSIGCNAAKTTCTTPAYPDYECIHAEGIDGIQITGNCVMGNTRIYGIYLLKCNNFSVKGNAINVDANGNQCNSVLFQGINVTGGEGIIGGDQPADKNIIAYTGNYAGIFVTGKQVTISRNSTYCNSQQNYGSIYVSTDDPLKPTFSVLTATANTISGKALPGAAVELFIDDDCPLCEGKTYITTVLADQNGNWVYNGTSTNKMVATATATDGSTTGFSNPRINPYQLPVKKPASCGLANGSITNLQILSGTSWHWEDASGNIVGTDTSLYNALPGKYRLVVEIGGPFCSFKTDYIEIPNVSLPAAVTPVVVSSSCGLNNGSISVNYNTTDYTGKWLNASMDSIATGTLLDKALPGNYYLRLFLSTDAACNQVFGPFLVTNQSGASLNTNNMQVTAATCSNSNGSITGIIAVNATGVPFVQWVDSLNKPVGSGYGLSNIPPGKYRLKFKDAGGCDTIFTAFYTVPDNGKIIIDTTGKIVSAAKCNGAGGSILQIKVTGADTYNWITTGQNGIAGGNIDLTDAAPGSYTLFAFNQYGCSKASPVIVVPPASFTGIAVTGVTAQDARCAQPTGMVTINSFTRDPGLYTFLWKDSVTGQTTGAGTTLSNLGSGTYQLFATDNNGCNQQIFTARIKNIPPPVIDYSKAQLIPDNCNLHTGSITAIQVTGLSGPTTYTWHNQLNALAGNSLNLQNAGAGSYILTITDGGCQVTSKPFIVNNSDNALATPFYADLTIPRYTEASLSVKNPATGTYTLFVNAAGTAAVQHNSSGTFNIPALATDTSFYVQRVAGECASAITKVNIKVVDKSFFAVPTAFTPNSDGKNDRLSVKVIGYIQLGYFRIFDRFGQLVFETHTVNDGWNGFRNGILQNTGGYVWIAQGKDITGNKVSGKGSFILIR